MPKGRKPKPTALKLVEGNPGHRPINHNEPRPNRVAPPCPDVLKDEERLAWDYLIDELRKMGTLASSDKADMTCYAHWFGTLIKAKSKLIELKAAGDGRDPEVIKTAAGNFIQNPWLSIANTAAKELAKICEKLGLDPTSRVRLTLPAPQGRSLREELMSECKNLIR